MKQMKRQNKNNNIDAMIGGNLKKFREMRGIRRKELANMFQITEDALYRIEKGQTGLSPVYAYILANELHCDMNFIYGRTRTPRRIETEHTEESHRKIMARTLRYYAEILDKMNNK